MTIGRPHNLAGTRTGAMIEFITGKGPEGARRAELAELLGVPSKRISGYMEYASKCGVIVVGPDKHYRFFTDPAHAEAYAAALPALAIEKRAAAKRRHLDQQAAYRGRKLAAKVDRVAEAVIAAGQKGLCRKEVDDLISEGRDCSDAISNACRQKLIYAGGPLQFRRYFGTEEWAQDWDISGKEARDAKVKESARERSRRNAHAKRQRDAAYREAKRKERAKDVSRRANALVVTPGRSAPVNVKAPTRADLATAAMVIPPGVEVQRCKPWTHDVRYSVEPGRRVIGEFTTEWRQRRAA